MFIQSDFEWGDLHLGSSDLTMDGEGCLTCCQAFAMRLAGYAITPKELCLDASLYTDQNHRQGGGLWLWYAMGNKYPYYHIALDSSKHYKFVQVVATWGGRQYQHWVLEVDGIYHDPIDGAGSPTLKQNYRPTGRVYSADIDPATVQTTFASFLENLEPSQERRDEVGRVQDYLIAKGYMESPGGNRGFYGPKTQAAIDRFQKEHGIMASPKYFGWWYDRTREEANKQLSI